MRYRRLRYRYAVVLAAHGLPSVPAQAGHGWHAEHPAVALARSRWLPPTDVYETAAAVHVTVELAGVDPDELDVLLYEDALVVEGRRRLPPAEPGAVYHAARIRQGPFRLELHLPVPIDPERADAHYDRGLLQMALTKT